MNKENLLRRTFNRHKKLLKGPEDATKLASKLITDPLKEHVIVLFLDAQGKCFGAEIVSIGTISNTLIHPREILSAAITARAANFVVLHNHPSGKAEPSKEDLAVTARLKIAARFIDIMLIEHIIFNSQGDWKIIKGNFSGGYFPGLMENCF